MLVVQSYLTFCDPMECSLLSSSVYGLLQAIILEGVAISFSRGPSQPRDQTWVSCITGRFFIVWTAREAQSKFSGNEVPLLLFIRGSCNLAFSSEGQFCWAKYSWLIVYFFQYFGYIISFFLGLQGLCWGIHWSLYGNSLVWEIFFPCCFFFFFFFNHTVVCSILVPRQDWAFTPCSGCMEA